MEQAEKKTTPSPRLASSRRFDRTPRRPPRSFLFPGLDHSVALDGADQDPKVERLLVYGLKREGQVQPFPQFWYTLPLFAIVYFVPVFVQMAVGFQYLSRNFVR